MFDLNVFGILAGIGTLVAGLGFAYSQFNSGSVKAKDELITTLRETAIAEKDKAERLAAEKLILINSHQQQINDLNNKIGKLQGLYEASEVSKKEYLEILQGRDPAQKKFMEVMTAASEQSNTILIEIRTFMQNLNSKANQTEKWHESIDEATKEGTGSQLRKKV